LSPEEIRPLRETELSSALALSTAAGWNQRRDDWQMLLQLAPAGSFCASLDGRIVGTAIGIDYGGFGWIAMMLVDQASRGRGIGRQLLEAALQAIPDDRPVRLDATPMGRPLYQRYNFHDEAQLTRHVARAVGDIPTDEKSPTVRPMTEADLTLVSARDREVFGGNRDAVLQWSLRLGAKYAWILVDGDGLAHYCLGRQGCLFDQIGPVVSRDLSIARALVSSAVTGANGRPIGIDAFDANPSFTRWLALRGFEAQRPLYRMLRAPRSGAVPARNSPVARTEELAILGPEFA
jgi:GNAT superfamily N-acetyltransferase